MFSPKKFLFFVLSLGLSLVILVLSNGCATKPFEKWMQVDTERVMTMQTALLLDMGTTLDIKKHPDMLEINPVM